MRTLLAIIKKEFTRFFLDRRMLLTTIVMPFALMYILYAFMGSLISDLAATDTAYTVAVRNMSGYLGSVFDQTEVFNITDATEDDEYYIEQVQSGNLDIFVIFPENFDSVVGEIAGGGISSSSELNVEI